MHVMVKPESGFAGFHRGEREPIPLPIELFTELLPAVDDLRELTVTLYAFWAVHRQGGDAPHLRKAELLADERLLGAMEAPDEAAQEALETALDRAVQRGSLLRTAQQTGEGEVLYFLNDSAGRAALTALERGDWSPELGIRELRLQADRPNVYVLYEQNIGALTPLLAERLQAAEREYPAAWIEEAIGIAVENNARKWRYIEAILEDWKTKGRDEREDRRDTEEARQRYLGGEFGEFIEH